MNMIVNTSRRVARRVFSSSRALLAAALLLAAPHAVQAQATGTTADPRVGLKAGWMDAGYASSNLKMVAHVARPEGFYNPENPGDFGYMNSDLAFSGNHLFVGNFSGIQIYDISEPSNPTLRVALNCPGGQGDVSVHGDLLFMSVEETRGRLDCGPQGVSQPSSDERFRGLRIFDISDVERPQQVAAIQTCRGSHTHTIVPSASDPENLYVYISGTSSVRPGTELEGCSGLPPEEDPNTALFRIEVVQVPLAAPQNARVVNMPRIFSDDEGNIAGLWRGGAHGEGTQRTAVTDQCHDITVYPELGLAAGACSGNGILLDISDPANPTRIDQVVDPNFAYWHSATFSNDGRRVIFTDEWGGGMGPRCRATDRPEWGANAIFSIEDGKMQHEGYYKLPVAQSDQENCVAHNGSLIPIPGRDVMVQAWYQGGLSVFDFTDPQNPVEIAYFDRGPMRDDRLVMAGYWSAYWYNGHIYASEIGRGLDVFQLLPSEHLTLSEIVAAEQVEEEVVNPQNQTALAWQPAYTVARAYLDQLHRTGGLSTEQSMRLAAHLYDAHHTNGPARQQAAAALVETTQQLEQDAEAMHAERLRRMNATLQAMQGTRP